jgi:inner membrane protein
MIERLIVERELTQTTAISEVSAKWGQEQTITGPILTIPYQPNASSTKEYVHILPENLDISGAINPEARHRGIYEIVVYDSKLSLKGNYTFQDLSTLNIDQSKLLWNEAFVSLGISDLKGIEKQVELKWNDSTHFFNSGVVTYDIIGNGITAFIPLTPNSSGKINFNLDLQLKGSQFLHFIPMGKVTNTNIASSWNNPSFNGQFLPDSSNISGNGFDANWNILHLNRNYPQAWIGSQYQVHESAFGVDLILPVDNYQKTTRSIKYAILFLVMTFMVFFFIEIFNKRFLHPIQYLLVGLALIIFYTLQLSLSEYLNFNSAFLIAAGATIALVAGYARAILKSAMLSFMLSGILAVLYGFIFVIIQMQDYSLLIGSIGIFLILAIVMYASRKIDWFEIGK